MMRRGVGGLVVMLGLWALPAAADRGHVTAGMVVWSQATDMKVESATDFDGSDQTAEQRAKDWNMRGSGTGIRLGYEFPRFVSVYGEFGTAQMTVNERDVLDVDQDVDSHGMDEGHHLGAGARVSSVLAENGGIFWSAGAGFTTVSTSLDEATGVTWDLETTSLHLDGRLGTQFRGVGLFGGLRFAQSNGDLEETDLTRTPGDQVRAIELERDGQLDVLLGAQAYRQGIQANVEVGLVGTFSAEAAFSVQF